MPEIRFTITRKLNKLILEVSEGLGVDKSDYVKSLILHDLKDRIKKNDKSDWYLQWKKKEKKKIN